MALSVRTRFEVFKRDDFRCGYCGRRSPDVVLEVDHIVAVANGGSDDPINLKTSCWDCNHGKAAVPLAYVLTGEDPHDRAVMLLERKRQLEEYNLVVAEDRERREAEAWQLIDYWNQERGRKDGDIKTSEYRWMLSTLTFCPLEKVREFLDYALFRGFERDLRYVMACVRNWRQQQQAEQQQAQQQEKADADEWDGAQARDDYERTKLIEEVLYQTREADHWRRAIGYCPHESDCGGTLECVQRQVRTFMGIDPENRFRIEL